MYACISLENIRLETEIKCQKINLRLLEIYCDIIYMPLSFRTIEKLKSSLNICLKVQYMSAVNYKRRFTMLLFSETL